MPSESTYGEWLLKTRSGLGWTQQQLADQSGVSGPQISNIETGKSPNPRAATREKLEAALQAQPPDTTVKEAEAESQIADLGTLEDFDPYAETLPECSGVYALYDLTSRPVYVGKSTKRDIGVRIREHYDRFWFKRPIVDRGAFIQIDDEQLCGRVEQVLIKFMKSNALFNKQHVDRGE